MNLGYTILYVSDVAETVAFYHVAFGLEPGMRTDSNEYAEMLTGNTKLAFANIEFATGLSNAPVEHAAPSKPAPPFELGLVTDHVQAAYERAVAAGAVAVKTPHAKPWGQIVGYVRDNNGFLIEICSPLG